MHRRFSPEFEGTDWDADDAMVTAGDNGVSYPDTSWLDAPAGASGMELRAEQEYEAELPDCAREGMGQLNVFGDRAA